MFDTRYSDWVILLKQCIFLYLPQIPSVSLCRLGLTRSILFSLRSLYHGKSNQEMLSGFDELGNGSIVTVYLVYKTQMCWLVVVRYCVMKGKSIYAQFLSYLNSKPRNDVDVRVDLLNKLSKHSGNNSSKTFTALCVDQNYYPSSS